ALAVTENLHFDVTRIGDKLLKEDAVVRKIVGTQAFHGVPRVLQVRGITADLHADAAATGTALEHYRVAGLPGPGKRALQVFEHGRARQHGDAGLPGGIARRVLEAEDLHLLR